jgi:hypothetical protein
MAQFTPSAAYLAIEDRLDAVGQQVRGQRIVRGAVLFLAAAVVVTWVAALAAHFIGDASGGTSRWTWVVLAAWAVALVAAAVAWVVRPLLIRAPAVRVARMLESRIPGLNNGLTNAVLLSRARDLQESPYLPAIFDEVNAKLSAAPVGHAVRWADLNPVLLRAGLVSLPLLLSAAAFPRPFTHGWRQLTHPAAFVPQTGAITFAKVSPGDVTLVADQPLEITAVATGPAAVLAAAPEAKLIFDGNTPPATLSATTGDDGTLHYAYRMDHVGASTRYRLESGGAQTPWYSATVVRQVKLTSLSAGVNPPAYTHAKPASINVKPDAPDADPVTVPQGSTIQVSAAFDVPVNGALLQVGDKPPVVMAGDLAKSTFSATFTATEDASVAVLATDGSGQVIAKLPEQAWMVHCTKDAAPTIEMHWPTTDATVAPAAAVKVAATLRDDYGVVSSRVLMAAGPDAPLAPVATANYPVGTTAVDLSDLLDLKPELRKHGSSIRVQVEVTDNRDLGGDAGGPQTTLSPIYTVQFRDPEVAAKEAAEQADQLRAILMAMLKDQRTLNTATVAWHAGDAGKMSSIGKGQTDLRDRMKQTADTFAFDESNRIVQKALLVLSLNPAADAVDTAAALARESSAARQATLSTQLQTDQRRIASTLESLLALLSPSPEATTRPTTRPGDQLASREQMNKLDEQLKAFMKEQQRLLDQTAALAKKPVDNWDDKDRKLAADLQQAQDKLDAFMKSVLSDFSKLAEQDMANASMAKEAQAIYSEVTMAAGALKQQATEIAVPAEENGLESAKELQSNIERWLSNTPDRQQWTQEDLPTHSDTPMPELPKELQDMVGELMEQQEDLFQQMEDMNANITDSADKGIGWDAADGPIADMSAKGVTGNQLPNNNEMGGRSGEGRSGRSQGEFVGDTAVGKGGRNTPTRLDPTAFQQGQIKDTSKDPVGGATGGGKVSGSGQAGLQGPVPARTVEGMKRLATKQAELRNTAERLNLQYGLDRYDNFRLRQATQLMRDVETDLNANRYQNALRHRDVLVDDLDASRMLLGGQVDVQQDTTPTTGMKVQKDLNDAMQGALPPAWSDPLKAYYKKLAAE